MKENCRLAELLGSSTRANIVEALALAREPLSAYRVSKMYNMNTAKVYIEMKKLANLGLVSSGRGNRGSKYSLADGNLRSLALKLSSSRVITYDEWRRPEAKAQRFRSGLIRVPKFSLGRPAKTLDAKPTRMPGELDTLALLAKNKFENKYRRTGDREYVRL